jgi:protein-S-isoprenylcysteine O-methyltransferase Ste14
VVDNVDKAGIIEGGCTHLPPSPPMRHPPHPPDASPGVIRLRRYRRYVPLPLIVLTVVFLRPTLPFGSPLLDVVTDSVGVLICALGQWLRMWAWGSNAAVGKWGVRDRGPYKLMRHPLYAGNFLILAGLVVIFHNLWAYPLLLFPFAYMYHAITTMEEQRLRRRFTEDYHEYRTDTVPRFVPALGNMRAALQTTFPFGLGLAWRKEFESCCGWLAGVAVLQIYEGVLLYGWTDNWRYTVRWLLLLGVVGIVALLSRVWKSTSRIPPSVANPTGSS